MFNHFAMGWKGFLKIFILQKECLIFQQVLLFKVLRVQTEDLGLCWLLPAELLSDQHRENQRAGEEFLQV